MFSIRCTHAFPKLRRHFALLIFFLLIAETFIIQPLAVAAQDQSTPAPSGQKQEPPPEAGGPQTDVGPYAVPKKKEEPPAPPPERPKKIEGMPDYSLKVDVPLVNVP